MKIWIFSGLLYVGLVITGYSLVTGENPFSSGQLGHGTHSGSENEEVHQHHNSEHSEVATNVAYIDEEMNVEVADADGSPVELNVSHEKLMHLIVVSKDLESFYHLHPEKRGDTKFTVATSIESGDYHAFVDISPVGKSYHIEANELTIGDSEDTLSANLEESSLTQEVQGKKVTLETTGLKTNEKTELAFDLHGEQPQTYLGALGHVVILDESAETFIHVHPDSATETIFETAFDEPGMYKVWAEFNYEDVGVQVFPFVIEVK